MPQHLNVSRMDKYSNYTDLAASEREGADFQVLVLERNGASAAIIATHAGGIEPKTGLIARDIAGTEFSLYRFRGIKKKCNRDLHITSHNFDEPRCLSLIANHKRVIAIHGCDENGERVFLSGLDNTLIDDLVFGLRRVGIIAETSGHKYTGTLPNNICNRGQAKKGIQFELSLQFRNGTQVPAFVRAVRAVLCGRNNP